MVTPSSIVRYVPVVRRLLRARDHIIALQREVIELKQRLAICEQSLVNHPTSPCAAEPLSTPEREPQNFQAQMLMLPYQQVPGGKKKEDIRSNVPHWQELQENDYFDRHPWYQGLRETGADDECQVIECFTPLTPNKLVVVIGCGYGRESVHIARRTRHVYGIDVSEKVLGKAVKFTRERGVTNFTPVLAERFEADTPDGIDLVFSIVVFQHLTRDLARNYLKVLGDKLSHDGVMVIQFLEALGIAPDNDAELKVYEPSVSYSVQQVVGMARSVGLTLKGARSLMATEEALWHWVHLGH